jgi:hypothetical protein
MSNCAKRHMIWRTRFLAATVNELTAVAFKLYTACTPATCAGNVHNVRRRLVRQRRLREWLAQPVCLHVMGAFNER